MPNSALDETCINTLRFLAVDMVEKAKSGHPGLPLGAAAMAYTLWTRHLKHDPLDPQWADRDRFVLSAGHGSALLYALLHLTGYDLPLEQLQRFRQWGSLTPGHPEFGLTPGVEASTGPLGQGIANAVGMAIAEAHLAARFNRSGYPLFKHFTYALASDGDMMEGVQAEACSLAGQLGLGRLIVLYDNNHVTLSADAEICFTEDVGARYAACGWHVQSVDDGNDVAAVSAAIEAAQAVTDRPSLILVQTVLGYGAPNKQGSYHAHGSPLGAEETRLAKQALGWPTEPDFIVPVEAYTHFGIASERGRVRRAQWQEAFKAYAHEHPKPAAELERRFKRDLPLGWAQTLPVFEADPKGLATRKASEAVLQALAATVPELLGGSGDLDPSTNTGLKGQGDLESPAVAAKELAGRLGGDRGYDGRNLHFGVREHAMAAACNGMAYHGGVIPFAATFFVFSDYLRPALRMAALTKLPVLFVFTHDSVAVGEDGPSHEPVEHLAALRAMPGLTLLRPADANECRWAWQMALERQNGPVALVLSRQSLPTLDRKVYASAEGLRHGAYVLDDGPGQGTPDLILIASGSEVALIVEAAAILRAQGRRVRLVSMPSWSLFQEQDAAYRDAVLPPAVTARLAVEAGVSLGWERWVGDRGAVLGIDRFGASAPGGTVLKELGFSAGAVVARAQALL